MESSLADNHMYQFIQAMVEDRNDVDLRLLRETEMKHAMDVGLGPLLFRVSRHGEPGAWKDILYAQNLAARVESEIRLDALDEILSACTPAISETIVLLKGISLCLRVYPEAHLRMMGDIDLLVPATMVRHVESVLRQLGYVQRSEQVPEFYASHHHSMPFVHPRHETVIEVHTGLFPPDVPLSGSRNFQRDSVISKTESMQFRGHTVRHLDTETELAYLAAHWINERECFGFAIIPILDLAMLIHQHGEKLDWEHFIASLRYSPEASYVRVALGFVHDRAGIRLPGDFRKQLDRLTAKPGRMVDPVLHRMIQRYAVHGHALGSFWTREVASIVWKTLLMPRSSWMNYCSLSWNILFPPAAPHRYEPSFLVERMRSALRRQRHRHNRLQ